MEKQTKDEPPTRREQLGQLGLLVMTSDELENRINSRKNFSALLHSFNKDVYDKKDETKKLSPSKQIEAMLDSLTTVDNLLKEVSVPWGRGAENKWYGVAMLGWERLLAKARNDTQICLNVVLEQEQKGVEDWILVRQLRAFLMSAVLMYAQYIEDVSWRGDDVAAKYNLVVQLPQTEAGRGRPPPRAGSMQYP